MPLGGAGEEKKKMTVLRILFFFLSHSKFNFSPSDIFVSFLSAWSAFALLLAASMSHQKKEKKKRKLFLDGRALYIDVFQARGVK